MMKIPNIMADTVPIGKDDSENVERQTFGEKTNMILRYHIILIF